MSLSKETDNDIELAEALKSAGVQQQEEFSVPGDVSSLPQLGEVPEELLNLDRESGRCDKYRPLLHTDSNGNVYTYALNPLTYSVFLILVLELLERFSFYGLYMTQTNYLTGSYDEKWNADMTSMDAASLISLSTAVAYTVPFVGGMLADTYLGDYRTILVGFVFFYLPGVFVIASSTTPTWWLGTDYFNVGAYKLALLFLW
jgi:POT family proton-dependent oligopeptide transporter